MVQIGTPRRGGVGHGRLRSAGHLPAASCTEGKNVKKKNWAAWKIIGASKAAGEENGNPVNGGTRTIPIGGQIGVTIKTHPEGHACEAKGERNHHGHNLSEERALDSPCQPTAKKKKHSNSESARPLVRSDKSAQTFQSGWRKSDPLRGAENYGFAKP